jgi:hypothetical protein
VKTFRNRPFSPDTAAASGSLEIAVAVRRPCRLAVPPAPPEPIPSALQLDDPGIYSDPETRTVCIVGKRECRPGPGLYWRAVLRLNTGQSQFFFATSNNLVSNFKVTAAALTCLGRGCRDAAGDDGPGDGDDVARPAEAAGWSGAR